MLMTSIKAMILSVPFLVLSVIVLSLIILAFGAALIARYPFAVAARLPLSIHSCPPLAESRKGCRTSGPDAA